VLGRSAQVAPPGRHGLQGQKPDRHPRTCRGASESAPKQPSVYGVPTDQNGLCHLTSALRSMNRSSTRVGRASTIAHNPCGRLIGLMRHSTPIKASPTALAGSTNVGSPVQRTYDLGSQRLGLAGELVVVEEQNSHHRLGFLRRDLICLALVRKEEIPCQRLRFKELLAPCHRVAVQAEVNEDVGRSTTFAAISGVRVTTRMGSAGRSAAR
jgi:hypothetical protein